MFLSISSSLFLFYVPGICLKKKKTSLFYLLGLKANFKMISYLIIFLFLKNKGSKRTSKIIPLNNAPESTKSTIKIARKKRKINTITDESTIKDPSGRSFSESHLSQVDNEYLNTGAEVGDTDDDIDNMNNSDDDEEIVEGAVGSDLVVKDSNSQLSQQDKLDPSLFKLYRVVLEQTNLDSWHNNECIEIEPEELEVKQDNAFTIISQHPTNKNLPDKKRKNLNPNLGVCELEFWSNEHKELICGQKENFGTILIKTEDFDLRPMMFERRTQQNDSGYMTLPPIPSRVSSSSNEDELDLSPNIKKPLIHQKKSFERTLSSPSDSISPVVELDNQLQFYKRIEKSFFNELDKSILQTCAEPTPSILRRSTSIEQRFFNLSDHERSKSPMTLFCIKSSSPKNFSIDSDNADYPSDLMLQTSSNQIVPQILVETQESQMVAANEDDFTKVTQESFESDKSIQHNEKKPQLNNLFTNESLDECCYSLSSSNSLNYEILSCHGNASVEEIKKEEKLLSQMNEKISNEENFKDTMESAMDQEVKVLMSGADTRSVGNDEASSSGSSFKVVKKRRIISPLKKSRKSSSFEQTESPHNKNSMSSRSPNTAAEDEEDEFFLAISSSRLETGSCPHFFWYQTAPTNSGPIPDKNHILRRKTKSFSDLSGSILKSYENITHTNYVQMVNSMITGAISDVADPEYVEYVKRHIQGLFYNYTPVLLKSRSNEEMSIYSPSRDQIAEAISQSMPKSLSFDLQLIEESRLNLEHLEDAMDFSKFGLGIGADRLTQHSDKKIKVLIEEKKDKSTTNENLEQNDIFSNIEPSEWNLEPIGWSPDSPISKLQEAFFHNDDNSPLDKTDVKVNL